MAADDAQLPNREALAAALHAVFEGFVSHLPPDDPAWLRYADEVLDGLAAAAESGRVTEAEQRMRSLSKLIGQDERERGPIPEQELAHVRDELNRLDRD